MRFFGQICRCERSSLLGLRAAVRALLLVLLAGVPAACLAQTAPYVLPYTMSTYAGPHAAYTAGAACGTNSKAIALNASGDGCPAASVSVGADPHDVRVDARGNVYYIDNGSTIYIHKISPQTGQQTVFVGGRTCSSTDSLSYGNGCPANDGAANNNNSVFTVASKFKAQRGLGMAPNGDLYSAGYNDYEVHRYSAATGIESLVAGTGTANANVSSTSSYTGATSTTGLNSNRGVGVDAAGNVYIADTGSNVILEATIGGQLIALTGNNSAAAKTIQSGIPATSAIVNAPEDVQVDSNGNIYIADAGNNVVRAIYSGKGTLPGISNPVAGYIYTVAGNGGTAAPNNTYPSDGTTPTVPATNVQLTDRKIALDAQNNLYIADSSNNVVWFVDATTGYIRTIAGRFGQTASATPTFVCNAAVSAVGDGCPGSSSSLFSASDMGAAPDNQGNVYITDAEGGVANASRIRKLLSGLNFPTTTLGGTGTTQIVRIHFAAGDTPASASPFTISGAGYTASVPAGGCTANADNTDDCLVNVTFTPTFPGYQTAVLTITSAAGSTNTYQLTGTGTGPSLAIDPGYLTAFNTTVKGAQGVTADVAGNVYIVDTGNNRVLRYNAATTTTTPFAGNGTAGFTGDGAAATAATLKAPTAVAVDTTGSVFITDTGNNVVRRVAGGIITTYAGGGTACAPTANACLATQTSFNAPTGIATDNQGQVYVADSGNNLIRQISNDGFVFALAGGGTSACTGATDTQNDGCAGLQGIFNTPFHLAFDQIGSFLVVADAGNNIVRKILLANSFAITGTATATAQVNPLTLVAGTGQANSSTGSTAIVSGLSGPKGVAVDAGENIVIADTGNAAIRYVNNATGTISTIAGVLGTSGAGNVPGNATSVQLASPTGVALSGGNNLYIADTANNRVVLDNRSQVTYNFGRVNQGTSSPTAVFTETNTGTSTETFGTPFTTMSGSTDFTLTPSSSSACTGGGVLTAGAACLLNAVFTPTTTGSESATYTEANALTASAAPSINLIGIGAILTKTTSTLAQTSPATGNPQFGGNFTLTATVTAQACNTTGAPACYPTGTVTFTVDGQTVGSPVMLSTPASNTALAATASQVISGLGTGVHTATCLYSGDAFYGASSCGNLTITVAQASTTSTLVAATTGRPQFPTTNCSTITSGTLAGDTQCAGETLTATVVSNTSGVPTGNVTFSNGSTPLGTVSLSSSGVATLALYYIVDRNGNLVSDATLPAGSYNLSCTYNGATNFATSSCAAVAFTVVAQTAAFTLTPRGCALTGLYQAGTTNPLEQGICNSGAANPNTANGDTLINGYPQVATADGSTTDVTIFINRANTLSGAVTLGCTGLPQYSICTFAPSVPVLTGSTGFAAPYPIDVTLWTDIRPGNATSALHAPDLGRGNGTMLAMLLGWPVTLLGLGVVVRSRRKGKAGLLPWLAALLVMAGSVTALTGCGLGGPGVDKVVLTPAGTYPITISVTVGGTTQTTQVYFKVASPGITGQQ